jgi:prepilin-type processing-associated H-X9-DG protein
VAFTPGVPLGALGSSHPGGENALFGDGSVKFIRNTTDPQTLMDLATRAGAEPTSIP